MDNRRWCGGEWRRDGGGTLWVQKEKEAAARENYGEGEISENWV